MGRREGPSEERKERIVEAAERVFSERGYAGAAIREIARQAGVSSALLYWFFPDKASLFVAVLTRRVMGEETVVFLPPGFLDLPPEVVIPAIATRYLATMGSPEQIRLIRMMITESQREPELIGKLVSELQSRALEPFSQYLARQVELGRMREVDPALATQSLFGMLLAFILRRDLMQDKTIAHYSNEEVAVNVADIFLNGMRGSGKGVDPALFRREEQEGSRRRVKVELED